MTNATKIGIIFMLSASALCVWSVAWMVVTSYRLVRDSL